MTTIMLLLYFSTVAEGIIALAFIGVVVGLLVGLASFLILGDSSSEEERVIAWKFFRGGAIGLAISATIFILTPSQEVVQQITALYAGGLLMETDAMQTLGPKAVEAIERVLDDVKLPEGE